MRSFKHTKVELSPDVLFQEVEGEAVLLDLSSGEYYGLNEVGTRFWEAARDTARMDAIFERLLDDFDVDEATLEADLSAFVEEMVDAGLMQVVEE